MRSEVARDWEWANRHLIDIINIIKQNSGHIISVRVAPLGQDMECATDLIVKAVGGDVCVRIRRPTEHRDFTVRAERLSGAKTELGKIREGFGDWYLYAWTDMHEKLIDWIFIDLDCVRRKDLLDQGRPLIPNPGHYTKFIAISLEELGDCVVARQGI